MSIINKMLQDLDRRQGRVDQDATLVQQVRTVAPPRKHREWFWRVIAVLMIASLGWVGWIAWQLQPRPQIATEQAFKAAQTILKKPATSVGAPAPTPPVAQAPAVAESTSVAPAAVAPPAVAAAPEPATPPAVAPVTPAPAPVPAPAVSSPPEAPKAPLPAPAAKTAEIAPPPAPKAPDLAKRAAEPTVTGKPSTASASSAASKGLNLDVPAARIFQAPAPSPATAAKVEKRDRERSPGDRAEADFRRAATLLNQGRTWEAEELFAAALAASPAHEGARQALVALSLEHNKVEDARRLLQEGVAINPGNTRFATVLARIHLERRNHAAAIDVVNNVRLPEQNQPDLQLLRGTALQKLGRHAEAVESFQNAVGGEQQNGPALLGLATSLEALARRQEAADAYRRAAAAPTLGQDVRTYAAQRARALQ